MEPTNLLPIINLVKEHVENNAIHVASDLIKIGEITPESFNSYEPHNYVKVQFAGAIPDGKYINGLFYKFFEEFVSTSNVNINQLGVDNQSVVNEVGNVIIGNANSILTDININIALSAQNALDWTAGKIGVFASFASIPALNLATRQLH